MAKFSFFLIRDPDQLTNRRLKKYYFNPSIKRINPAWVAEKNKFNEAKQKSNAKGGGKVKHSHPSGNRQQA